MASINFFVEEIDFKLPRPLKTSQWIKKSVLKEKKSILSLNFIFCNDDHLKAINTQYLNHSTLTDIITFDQSDDSSMLEGDIYISVDRVKENALKFHTTLDEELHRVIIHGVLHLMGYKDKKKSDKDLMRKKEDAYLSLR